MVPDSCSAFLLAAASAPGRFMYSEEKMMMIYECTVIVPQLFSWLTSCRCRRLQQEWCSCWWQVWQCRSATWSCSLTGVVHIGHDLLWPDVGGKYFKSVCIKEHCKVPACGGPGLVFVDLVVMGPGLSSTSPHLSRNDLLMLPVISEVEGSCCRWEVTLVWSKDFNK